MESWIEHRRPGDKEIVGWILLGDDGAGHDVAAIDRLGRVVWRGTDYLEAEQVLEERGIGWLADLWQLTLPSGAVRRVRIVEVSPRGVRVKEDDFGDVTASLTFHDLPFPAPAVLAPFAGDRGLIDGL
ncbi:hypothetical protein C8046_10510 [Serinibacter arcticus]|uniref:Uncharacterized protein n=1 Tax=Serinibacter arcticus TaxID=1655435 RepID=A0A2U1ZVJ7_9MICO|nr:hypothetical protein [Serinibacter arcticus]PWD51017.1 hypothetical protein C8046_10510 [Serinibacter arcticus]